MTTPSLEGESSPTLPTMEQKQKPRTMFYSLNQNNGNNNMVFWLDFYKMHTWLDRLPPFNHESRMTHEPSLEIWIQTNKANFYLHKFQCLLLSNPTLLPIDYGKILELITKVNIPADFDGKLSLQLLCLAGTKQFEKAFELFVEQFPAVALDYGKKFCKEGFEWKFLLDRLLKFAVTNRPSPQVLKITKNDNEVNENENENEDDQPPVLVTYREVYEKLLHDLTNILTPDDYLQLLPKEGNIQAFLPFIIESFHRYRSRGLLVAIASDAKKHDIEDTGYF